MTEVMLINRRPLLCPRCGAQVGPYRTQDELLVVCPSCSWLDDPTRAVLNVEH